MGYKLFPYEPRPNQKAIVESLDRVLRSGGHLVVESGTGSGKTIVSLAPCLEYAMKNNKKVVYLTRTNSQQKQVIRELRAINEKVKVLGVGLQGRANMCTLMKSDKNMRDGTAEELSKLCSEKKLATTEGKKKGGCRFYENLINANMSRMEEFVRERLPTVEEMVEYCESDEICPYETNKALIKEATVVTAPYIFFFSPRIRNSFLNWLAADLGDLIVIVDEAHNLPDYARELKSAEMSLNSIEMAIKEARKLGDPRVAEDLSIVDICTHTFDAVSELAAEYVIDEDGLVPPNELETHLMSATTMTSRELGRALTDMQTHGEILKERMRKAGKLPRSYIWAVASFLLEWMAIEMDEFAKLAVSKHDNPRLEMYCLDPSMATRKLNHCHASVHMSGTLAPLDEYRDSIGLPEDTGLMTLPSPFPAENRLILFSEDYTTKFDVLGRDKDMLPRMKEAASTIIREFDRNILLFFPSYNILSEFRDMDMGGKKVFFEERGMGQEELMDTVQRFKDLRGAVLFAVMGGRISEGIDFPNDELEIALLVGIPYPKPSARQRSLLEYYEKKFGRGWDYTVKAPAIRKLLQSIGRLYRTETDRGAALILDRRAVQFRSQISEIRKSVDVIAEMSDFFGR